VGKIHARTKTSERKSCGDSSAVGRIVKRRTEEKRGKKILGGFRPFEGPGNSSFDKQGRGAIADVLAALSKKGEVGCLGLRRGGLSIVESPRKMTSYTLGAAQKKEKKKKKNTRVNCGISCSVALRGAGREKS